MGRHAREAGRRDHIAQRFNEAQQHVRFTTSIFTPGIAVRCDLCGETPVHHWPDTSRPTLGELIDTAARHFALEHGGRREKV